MKRFWAILAAVALAAPAAANDSTAEHSAGGLVLTRSDRIDDAKLRERDPEFMRRYDAWRSARA